MWTVHTFGRHFEMGRMKSTMGCSLSSEEEDEMGRERSIYFERWIEMDMGN